MATSLKSYLLKFRFLLNKDISIAPLVHYRIVFGLLMFLSTVRFWANGWIHQFYIEPEFHFTYYGFDWVKPLGHTGMYVLFSLMVLSSLGIMLGAFYRVSSILFFVAFSYVELLDKTFYLNHYYFVSIMSFILMLLPANGSLSLDNRLGLRERISTVPAWMVYVIIMQVSIVYFYAGVAKINSDWLIEAQPLKTWLKPKYDTAIIGELLRYDVTAYVFAWFGMLFDTLIPFVMLSRYWKLGFLVLVVFHVMTALLFPIGVFPYVMICGAVIFFPSRLHEKVHGMLLKLFDRGKKVTVDTLNSKKSRVIAAVLAVHLVIQLLVPWRYLMYPGDMFWTEEGFRFSWRVMLVEKEGEAFFYLKHPDYLGYKPIDHTEHLIPQQIKQMAYQPDMLIQYAHYLRDIYTGAVFIEGEDTIILDQPQVCADVFVTMNGRPSRLLISKDVVLSDKPYNLNHRDWLIQYD